MTSSKVITSVGCIMIALVAAILIYLFIKMPLENKKKCLKEWLKWAVVEAEKTLKSGTGKLKLRWVYDKCVSQFPWIVYFVSFETFAQWVDEALDWMRRELENNKALRDYVQQKNDL